MTKIMALPIIAVVLVLGLILGYEASGPSQDAKSIAIDATEQARIQYEPDQGLQRRREVIQRASRNDYREEILKERRAAAKARAEARAERQAARQAEREAEAEAEALAQAQEQESVAEPSSGGTVWDRLAMCESGGNWSYNGSSGYDGGLQFLPSTWTGVKPSGFPEYAWQASREQQIAAAEILLQSSGWGAWPACSSELGLR